jgi:hypothetical protein
VVEHRDHRIALGADASIHVHGSCHTLLATYPL